MGPSCGIDPMTYCTMSKHSTTELHPCLLFFGCALFKKQAFNTMSCSVSRDGQKMSKRKKNYPDPMEIVNEYGADALRYIDDNLPHLSGIPDFLFAIFSFSGYGHRNISGSLNFIKIIFKNFLVRPFSSMQVGWGCVLLV